jgi:hypothetical protein
MYRQGLGDCFLLTFPTTNPRQSYYMLIDCGVVMGHKKERNGTVSPSFKQIAEDIKKTTGGTLDLLAVTHEHYDHVIGFGNKDANAIFRTMTVNDVWFAWTENPEDHDATRLKDRLKKTSDALRMAIGRASPEAMQPISSVLDFMGAADGKVGGTAGAMNAVRALLKHGKPKYLDPGKLDTPLTLPNVPGVRIYVLGPPRNPARIKDLDPNIGQAYLTSEPPVAIQGTLTQSRAFLLAAQNACGMDLSSDEKELLNLSFPFNENLRIPREKAVKDPFFKSHYFDAPREAWRRIDDEWLGVGEELALQLDNYTNNTSLALAIELTNSGKVLILAADAQVGNWLSWGDLEWTLKDGASTKKIKIGDLLKRTALYKVGHHGSSNASLKPFVDQMTSPDLISLLSVDTRDAHSVGWANMPWTRLLNQLGGQGANNRRVIIQMDRYPTKKPAGMKDADWKAFQSRFQENELYMQYTVDG